MDEGVGQAGAGQRGSLSLSLVARHGGPERTLGHSSRNGCRRHLRVVVLRMNPWKTKALTARREMAWSGYTGCSCTADYHCA